MTDEIRLEKIADDFVEIYLKEHPVMIYSLDTEIEEYVENEGLSKIRDDIQREYMERKKYNSICVQCAICVKILCTSIYMGCVNRLLLPNLIMTFLALYISYQYPMQLLSR